jgi:hypothetical protein
LVTSEVGDEVLVYDQDSNHIHRLNETSAAVWRLCDGRRSVTDIALAAGMTDDTVRIALAKLADSNLLDGPLPIELRLTGQSRRKLLKRAVLAGAGATIVSVTAPIAAAAQSTSCNNCQSAIVSAGVAVGGSLPCVCPSGIVQVGACVRIPPGNVVNVSVTGCVL